MRIVYEFFLYGTQPQCIRRKLEQLKNSQDSYISVYKCSN